MKQLRRDNLSLLIAERFNGNQSALARHIERQADYISRVLKGTKALGEALAREIEQRCDLPPGWMDSAQIGIPLAAAIVSGSPLTPDEAAILAAYRALPDGWQYYVRRKTDELRRIAEALPRFVFESFKPLPPEDRYWQWEQDLNEYIRQKRENKPQGIGQ